MPLVNYTTMKEIKSSEPIALATPNQKSLQIVNKSLGIVTLNNSLEAQELEPNQSKIEPKEDKILFGIIGNQVFKFWAETLECASQTIEEISILTLATSEELEISQEQVKSLKQELVNESQKVAFWQVEVDACNKEIEALNIEMQNYYQLRKPERSFQ